MKKKGFTLIELLAVIAILAILLLIIAPNIVGLFDRNRREKYVSDGKGLITLAKYKINLEKYESIFITALNGCKIANATGLEFTEIYDPYGNLYNFNECQVMVCDASDKTDYYIKMYSTKNGVTTRMIEGEEDYNFISEEDLTIANVTKP